MALVPSRHLYFDLFRYTSSSAFPLKQPQNPHKWSPFIALEKPNCGIYKKLSTLCKWNAPNKGYSESGGRGSTMDRIVEKLRKVGYVDDGKGRDLGSGIESVESVFRSDGEVRFPWEKDEDEEGKEKWTARSKSRTFLAEVTLPDSELKRLRRVFYQLKSKIRIKGFGVNDEVLDAIRERWRTSEVVRLKVEGALALNMKRVHEMVEKRTGGLVIWRSGTSIALYRGVGYEVPSMHQNKKTSKRHEISANTSTRVTNKAVSGPLRFTLHGGVSESLLNSDATSVDEETKEIKLHTGATYENEVDELLDSLGPRYKEWPGCEPLPVDADMLPGIVPGYQPPLRMLPYGVRSSLGQKEASSLLRLARVLPPHFALGRNRQLQGLAVAMIKLWERSKITKIALKRGVQLTTSERMAEDLKKLTGGTLLSRRKDSLVFYRGKNFLCPEVSEALMERERLAKSFQDEEEQARLRASTVVVPNVEIVNQSASTGTLEETLDANSRWGKRLDGHHKEKIMREAEIVRHNNIVRKIEKKLALAERKLMKAEIALSKVEEFLKPAERQADPNSITDEERFMFRKLGLRMKAYLLLGRRGVFDGTVENMHLHWKYRELVKIRLKAKSFEQVKKIALALEAESGGILVSVDKVSKGYAIVVYRGKDYKRPSAIRPKNLLTKRKALAHSIEMQRREALLKHVSVLQTQVEKLRSEIEQMDNVGDEGDKELYDKLDSAYQTDDNETEDDDKGDEAFLEAYNSENDDIDDGNEDKSENSACSVDDGNDFSFNVQNQEVETEPEEGEDAAYFDTYDDDFDNDDMDNEDFDEEDEHDNWVQSSCAKLPIEST